MSLPKTVLIIEDDRLIRKVLEIRLRQTLKGIRVISAVDGVDATQKIQSEKPDVILLDLVLPGKNGFDILADVQNDLKTGKMAVFILSNLSNSQDIDRAVKLGAKSYFIKSDTDMTRLSTELLKYFSLLH